jgi:hypothetical protein
VILVSVGSDRGEESERGRPGDELPEDLQPHLVDPEEYVFPNNNRRRVPGYLYLVIAVALVVLVLVRGNGVFVNRGFLGAAVILGLTGVYSIVSGWNLAVDERDALVAAISEVGFPVGHASAQMGWRGVLSRPTWRILLYSADEPPTRRGFVLVDGVEAKVIDAFVEDNPEDWSELTGGAGPGTPDPAEAGTPEG